MKLTGIPARKPHENDAIPKIAPKWLKHDKQVLTLIAPNDFIHNLGSALPCLLPGARR